MKEELSTSDGFSITVTTPLSETEVDTGIVTTEQEIALLKQALADSLQLQAEMQVQITNINHKHANELKNMVNGGDEKELFDAITESWKYMNVKQDYNAWKTLDDMVTKHSDKFGEKVVDPLSASAISTADMQKYL